MQYEQLNQNTITFAMSPYTVLQDDRVLHVDTTAGAVIINLEAITGIKRDLWIHDVNGTNLITITPNGGNLINGLSTYTMQSAGNTMYLSSIDTGLRSLINSYIPPAVSSVTSLTRASALALIAGDTVLVGQQYKITDRRNCLLVGSSTNDFAMEGSMTITAGEFFNANQETLDVKYDIVNDQVEYYKDVRGNTLLSPVVFSNLATFLTSVRYGDINKTENTYASTGLTFTAGDTINYSVFDFGATVSNSGAMTMNDTYVNSFLITTGTPTIQSCRLDNGIQALTISGTSALTRCIIDKPALGASITLFNQTHTDKRCVSGFSNFETTLDITGLTTIDLTLRKIHGIVILTTSNTIETIDLITNGQTNHPVDFVCRTNGKDIRFDTADQENVAIADQIVGSEGVYYIKGSTITEDIITTRMNAGETVHYVVNVINNDYQWITDRSINWYDDYINAGALQTPAGWFGTSTVSGAIAGSTTVPVGFYGLLTQSCIAAVNSAHSLTRGVSGIVQGTQGKAVFNGRFRIGASLSDVTNVRNHYLGISDATSNGTEPLGGIYFRYTFNTGGNFWEAVSANGGVYTVTTTAVPVTTNTAYDFKIVMNRTWTQARYYIEGVLVATHNTNLPGAIQLSPKFSVRRDTGSGVSRQIDGVGMQFYFNNARV